MLVKAIEATSIDPEIKVHPAFTQAKRFLPVELADAKFVCSKCGDTDVEIFMGAWLPANKPFAELIHGTDWQWDHEVPTGYTEKSKGYCTKCEDNVIVHEKEVENPD